MREGINATMSSTMRKLSIEISKLGLRIRTPTPTNSDSETVGSGDEMQSMGIAAEDFLSTESCSVKLPLEIQQSVDKSKQANHLEDNKVCDQTTACAKPERPGLTRRSRSDMAKYSSTQIQRTGDRSPKTENISEDENRNREKVQEVSLLAKRAPLVRPGLSRKSRSDLVKYATLSRMEGTAGVSNNTRSNDDLQLPVCERGRETSPKIRYQVAPVQQQQQTEANAKQKRFKPRRSKSFTSLLGGKQKSRETTDPVSTEKRATFPRRRSLSGKEERKRGYKEEYSNGTVSSQSNTPSPVAKNEAKPTNTSRYRDELEAGRVPGLVRTQRSVRRSWTYEDIIGAQAPLFLKNTCHKDAISGVRPNDDMMETDFCSTEL